MSVWIIFAKNDTAQLFEEMRQFKKKGLYLWVTFEEQE